MAFRRGRIYVAAQGQMPGEDSRHGGDGRLPMSASARLADLECDIAESRRSAKSRNGRTARSTTKAKSSKSHRWHNAHVDGGNCLTMITEKCLPGLRRRIPTPSHVFLDAAPD